MNHCKSLFIKICTLTELIIEFHNIVLAMFPGYVHSRTATTVPGLVRITPTSHKIPDNLEVTMTRSLTEERQTWVPCSLGTR